MNSKKILVMVAMVLAMAGYSQANLLTNGDCESGNIGDSPGWFFAPGCSLFTGDSSGYGNKCIQAVLAPGTNSQAVNGVVAVTPGQIYNASIDFKTLGNFTQTNFDIAFLRFWDASGNFLGQPWIGVLTPTNGVWKTFTWETNIVAPPTAALADIYVTLGVYSSDSGVARFDNAVLTPEPATMLLLGLGGVALRMRNRTKKA